MRGLRTDPAGGSAQDGQRGRRRTGRKKSACGSAGFPRWGKTPCSIAGDPKPREHRRTARPRNTVKRKRREQGMKNYLDSIDRAALRSRAEQMLHTAGDACDQAGRFYEHHDRKRSAASRSSSSSSTRPACCRSVCGWVPASLNSSRSFARSSSQRLPQRGCTCCGACSLMRMRIERIQSSFSSFDS